MVGCTDMQESKIITCWLLVFLGAPLSSSFSLPLLNSTLKIRSCLTLRTLGFKKIVLRKLMWAKFGAGVRVVLTKSLEVPMPQPTQVSTAALTALGWTYSSQKIYFWNKIEEEDWQAGCFFPQRQKSVEKHHYKYCSFQLLSVVLKQEKSSPVFCVFRCCFPAALPLVWFSPAVSLLPSCVGGRWDKPALRKSALSLVLLHLLVFRFRVPERNKDFC